MLLVYFKLFLLISITCISATPARSKRQKHGHNRVKVEGCDNAVDGIGIDWDGSDTEINPEFYECDNLNQDFSSLPSIFEVECETPPEGGHVCINDEIVYKESVPLGGLHRPVWTTYGEYLFMPPQRWVHSMEHGAAVFLYNPCAPKDQIEKFKKLAKGCLRRHVITPYKKLPNNELFNIVTFGCRLKINKIDGFESKIADHLRKHAIVDGPERLLYQSGSYKAGLIEEAKIVSDIEDYDICPNYPK